MTREKNLLYDRGMQVLKGLRSLVYLLACLCLTLHLPSTSVQKKFFAEAHFVSLESDLDEQSQGEVTLVDIPLLFSSALPLASGQVCPSFICSFFAFYPDKHVSYHLYDIPPPYSLV